MVIELPKGGYTPAFREAGVEARPVAAASVRKSLPLGWIAVATVVLALALAAAWWIVRKDAPAAIAVLPLENLNHDPASDYLADGLTDDLIRTLSSFDGLAPRSRTSSFALKGVARTVRQIREELGVEYGVEGSVLRSGDSLRIDVQLIRTRDDYPLCGPGEFERAVSDVLALQDEISRTIVANLPVKLGHGRKHSVVNPEAYDMYLRARALGLQDGMAAFEQAIFRDPSFAPSYAGLAAAYAYKTGTTTSDLPTELPKMRAAAEKAIELDPRLPEAHSALGMAYARDAQWTQSEKSFRRAIPSWIPIALKVTATFAVYVLMQQGRITEALDQMRRAQRSDPLSPEGCDRSWLTCCFPLIATMRRLPEM